MATLSFKVSAEEAARIRRRARQERRTVSEYLRRRAVGDPATPGSAPGYRITTSRGTGLPVMIGPTGIPQVSAGDIRALLADFP